MLFPVKWLSPDEAWWWDAQSALSSADDDSFTTRAATGSRGIAAHAVQSRRLPLGSPVRAPRDSLPRPGCGKKGTSVDMKLSS